ncbi:MAG: hypothetical protein GDA44_08065 [Prochloron sp. SP5CPC1]|nr:hypothetical protein [Candidatus Paraprochloron terpiosi SP5CPC1]
MKTALSLLSSKQLKRDQRQRYLEMLHGEWERQHALISGLIELAGLDINLESESSSSVYLEDIIPAIVSTYPFSPRTRYHARLYYPSRFSPPILSRI